MRNILSILLCVCASAATSVTQFGITWTFADNETVGQFANGDYYVVGPVSITNINPATAVVVDRSRNGSMLNPIPNIPNTNGYDSTIGGYNAAFNVAIGVSDASPLVLPAGSSLISTISLDPVAPVTTSLSVAAVLTVVTSSPASGSFRPPYSGTDKTVRWTTNDLNYAKLLNLTSPTNAPALATLESQFEKPWFDHIVGFQGRSAHPYENMPEYGKDVAIGIGDAALSLLLDYTPAEKETLLISIVQLGIDLHGVAVQDGASWSADGGHSLGRKLPIMLAGIVLEDESLDDVFSKFIFQEDQQTWVVVQDDVGRDLYTGDGRTREEYIQADVGLPEWGVTHYYGPDRDGRNWDILYRDINGSGIVSHVLAATLIGGRTAWNWEPLFDYVDRFMVSEYAGGNDAHSNRVPAFHKSMWTAYRNYSPETPPTPRTTRAAAARVGTIRFR